MNPDIIYPGDWLCKNCSKTLSNHTLVPQHPPIRTDRRWCFAESELGYLKHSYQWFEPADNLTMVEEIAKQRKLV